MLGIICSVSVLGCSVAGPASIELTPASNDALLILYAPPAHINYTLNVASFDLARQQTQELPLGTRVEFLVHAMVPAHFMAEKVPPGTYVYQSFSQQGIWAVCFQRETLAFTVKPGDVVFLGILDPTKHMAELGQSALDKNEHVVHGAESRHYFDNITPPQISAPAGKTDELAKAKAYVTKSMPKVRAEVQPVSYQKTSFGAGHSLFGKRICGGYFKADPAKSSQ